MLLHNHLGWALSLSPRIAGGPQASRISTYPLLHVSVTHFTQGSRSYPPSPPPPNNGMRCPLSEHSTQPGDLLEGYFQFPQLHSIRRWEPPIGGQPPCLKHPRVSISQASKRLKGGFYKRAVVLWFKILTFRATKHKLQNLVTAHLPPPTLSGKTQLSRISAIRTHPGHSIKSTGSARKR